MDENTFLERLKEIKLKLEDNGNDITKIKEVIIELREFILKNEKALLNNFRNYNQYMKEFEKIYIIESAPDIRKNNGINYKKEMLPEQKIEYLAQKLRIMLTNPNIIRNEYDLKKDSLKGECIKSTEFILKECKRKGIDAVGYNVNTIYGEANIKNDLKICENGNHAFSIINIDGKRYIVDCTYRQFFAVTSNIKAKDYPGIYMIGNPKMREVAEKILKDGWIEASPENLKCYLDGFVMADRRSYEETGITSKEYISMIDSKKIDCEEEKIRGAKELLISSEEEYIIESKPYIDYDIDIEEFIESMTDEEKLTLIVQRERRTLSNLLRKDGNNYDLERDNLRGDCTESAERIENDCYFKNIPSACFYTTSGLGTSVELGHCFSIIELSGKNYILDCTYRQFFSKTNNEPKTDEDFRDPGIYMIEDEQRRKVAEKILKDGWIEASPENLKCYLDGFVMADRKSFEETGITYEEYAKMLLEKGMYVRSSITSTDLASETKENNICSSEILDVEKHFSRIIERGENQSWIYGD